MEPKIYLSEDHRIDTSLIDTNAIFILKRLRDAGHIAYLVGGSVRDLLLGRSPKDFDISTSATPEETRHLFHRHAILIGRRFRLAHVRFGHKIYEVSTFRTGDIENEGLITRDNEWGTPEQDVMRRDFTINGFFYDHENNAVIDYINGWEDIQSRILRTIGTPEKRFKQDPVRMIRLLKFQARLGFNVEAETLQALRNNHHEILNSSPARILEEFLRMLESGSSSSFFKLMSEEGFLELLFPAIGRFLKSSHGKETFKLLTAADHLHLSNVKETLDRSTLVSCLIFPILEYELVRRYLSQEQTPGYGEILQTIHEIIERTVTSSFSHFPKRLIHSISYILLTQYRLTPLNDRRPLTKRIWQNKECIMALKFLQIRAQAMPHLAEIYDWWEEHYQEESPHGDRLPHPHAATQKRKRTRKKIIA